jgi:hypothetical protein
MHAILCGAGHNLRLILGVPAGTLARPVRRDGHDILDHHAPREPDQVASSVLS